MTSLDLQTKTNRRPYQTPLLKNLGDVKELTKEEKGSVGGDTQGRVTIFN